MIQWSMTLTQNQIAVLELLEKREFGKPWDRPPGFSHWISHTRSLFAEGLIEQIETRRPNSPYNDPDRTGQFITERGRFILRMIREDMARFLDQEAPPKRQPRRAKGAVA